MSLLDKKILIVENEEDLSEALSAVLTQEGFEVIVAEDGESGFHAALEHKPDMIILDLMLPKMDGVTVLGKLRADAWGSKVPVIVLTALDDMNKIAEVIEAGGNDYIVKTNITLSGITDKVKEKLG